MPFRRPRHHADLDRVARILADERVGQPGSVGRRAGELDDGRDSGGAPAGRGWVPQRPRSVTQEEDDRRESVAARVATFGRALVTERLIDRSASPDDELARLDADLRRARRPALMTVPGEVASARRTSSVPAVVSLLALVVVASCVFGLRVLWAERSSTGQAVPPVATGPASRSLEVTGPTEPPGSAGAAPGVVNEAASTTAKLVVHVVGRVRRPGLVRLPPGSRVADAIAAAGGAREEADLSALNLARPLVDGEQVHVPAPGELVTPAPGPAGPGAAVGAGGALVDVNTADLAGLDTLPGVGPVLAQRIVDWRTEHGRFTSVDELGEVSGIGDKLLAQLRPRVTL